MARLRYASPVRVRPIFRPGVSLNVSQVHDLRYSAPMPVYSNPGGYRPPRAPSSSYKRGARRNKYRPPYPR